MFQKHRHRVTLDLEATQAGSERHAVPNIHFPVLYSSLQISFHHGVYLALEQVCVAAVEELDHTEAPLHTDAVRDPHTGVLLRDVNSGPWFGRSGTGANANHLRALADWISA